MKHLSDFLEGLLDTDFDIGVNDLPEQNLINILRKFRKKISGTTRSDNPYAKCGFTQNGFGPHIRKALDKCAKQSYPDMVKNDIRTHLLKGEQVVHVAQDGNKAEIELYVIVDGSICRFARNTRSNIDWYYVVANNTQIPSSEVPYWGDNEIYYIMQDHINFLDCVHKAIEMK